MSAPYKVVQVVQAAQQHAAQSMDRTLSGTWHRPRPMPSCLVRHMNLPGAMSKAHLICNGLANARCQICSLM